MGPGLDRRPDRRVHDVEEGEEPEGGEAAARRSSGRAAAENIYLKSDPNNFGANKNANKSKYTPLQKKSAVLIAETKHIAQYLDRDTRPDFASTVMIPALQQFLNNPDDVNSLVQQHPEAEDGDLRIVS